MARVEAIRLPLVALSLISGAILACPSQAMPQVRPLGDVRVISGPTPCQGWQCYEVEVRCPQLAESERAIITVGESPENSAARGTVLFFSGGVGSARWVSNSDESRRASNEIQAAGFRTVQVHWNRGWTLGAPGRAEGHSRLACRSATVLRWVHDFFGDAEGEEPFCVTGSSGGASQASYALAHYGHSGILDLVMPTGGPAINRIDLGCLPDDPAQRRFLYGQRQKERIVDAAFGFPPDGTGPCAQGDSAMREAFRDASLTIGNWDYSYPTTLVWFLFGENDQSVAVPHGRDFYERLMQEKSPHVRLDTVPNTGHRIQATREGADMIRDIILRECRAR